MISLANTGDFSDVSSRISRRIEFRLRFIGQYSPYRRDWGFDIQKGLWKRSRTQRALAL
jgi:hypothetical protein